MILWVLQERFVLTRTHNFYYCDATKNKKKTITKIAIDFLDFEIPGSGINISTAQAHVHFGIPMAII